MLVLVGSLFVLDMSVNEQQFSTHRNNIQAQYAFQLERLVESSADKMIQISGAASLNDGLINAIKKRQAYQITQELDSLDWHLQADAGLSIVGLFDAAGEEYARHVTGLAHNENLKKVLDNEAPVWTVDCSQTCQILSYTPLLVEGELLAVIALSEPLSHVLLRFHHVANIDTGLLSELDSAQSGQSVLANWERYLEAVTSPKQSRAILAQAAQTFSLEELQLKPQIIDLDDHIYELKALPFNNSQLVVMTEASSDYSQLAQAKTHSLKLALFILLLGEALLFAFLWTPLSRLKFSEHLVGLLAERRFDELAHEFKHARPEQKQIAQGALRLGDQFIAMQKQIADQSLRLDSIDHGVSDSQSELTVILDEFSSPVVVLNERGQVMVMNHYLKQQLCLPYARIIGQDIADFLQADRSVKLRLEDVVEGRLSHYELTAQCYDAHNNSHTYWWRFSAIQNGAGEDGLACRRLLMMGMPLAEPSRDSQRQWLEEHDLETSLLNAKGFSNVLQTYLDGNVSWKASAALPCPAKLVLLRLPALMLDESRVLRLQYLRFIEELVTTMERLVSADQASLMMARLDTNEFAFLLTGSDLEKLPVQLECYLVKAIAKLINEQQRLFFLACRVIASGDVYPSDVLFETRKLYQEKP